MNFIEGLFHLILFNFGGFVDSLNKTPVIITWFVFLFFCLIVILFFLKFFGEAGMYVYTVLAVIGGNIQVLKIVEFPFFPKPIALGTILFATTFLATDILAEYYGTRYARKNILIGFAGFLLMTLIMLFTLGFTPLDINTAGEKYSWALSVQNNLMGVFLPLPIFFAASMIAYIFSQYFDVWLYETISHFTQKKFLWIRNNISTMTSSLLDNTIFSVFAWIIFNPNPLDVNTVIFTYILGTYFLRITIAIFDTPFIYLAKYFVPKNVND